MPQAEMVCPAVGDRLASTQSGFAAAVNQILMQSQKKCQVFTNRCGAGLRVSAEENLLGKPSHYTGSSSISHCFPRLFQLQHHRQDMERKVGIWNKTAQGHRTGEGAEPASCALVVGEAHVLSIILSALLKNSSKHSPA